MNNELRLNNVQGLNVKFARTKSGFGMVVTFSVNVPDDVYVLLSMQKKQLPLDVIISSAQKDLPLEDKQK